MAVVVITPLSFDGSSRPNTALAITRGESSDDDDDDNRSPEAPFNTNNCGELNTKMSLSLAEYALRR